jgi:hypothetical protein
MIVEKNFFEIDDEDFVVAVDIDDDSPGLD